MSVSRQIDALTRRVENLESLIQHKSNLTSEDARQYLFNNPPQPPVFSGGFFDLDEVEHPYGIYGYKKSYSHSGTGPFNVFTDLGGQIQVNGVDLVDRLDHPNLLWYEAGYMGQYQNISDPRNADLSFPAVNKVYLVRFTASILYVTVPSSNGSDAHDYQAKIDYTA